MEPCHRTASRAAFGAGVLAVSFFAAALSGCPEKAVEAPDGASTAAEHPATTASGTVGVRIHLPSGWVATPEGSDALTAGPRGRVVLRIARAKTSDLPNVEELSSSFIKDTRKLKIAPESATDEGGTVLWRARATAPAAEGGASWTLMLGARRANDGVYLCSTEPGATDSEVDAAANVCASLGE